MNSPTQFSTVNQPPQKQGKGCLFYGCLTAIVLIILSCIGIYFAVRSVVMSVTDATPLPFAKVVVSAEQEKATEDKFKAFQEAFRSGTPGATITLSSDEINTLLTTSPQLAKIGDMFRVDVVGDKLAAKMSVDLAPWGFSGRYVNGEGLLKVRLEGGTLVVNIDKFSMNGKPIPDEALGQLRQQNIAEEVTKKPEIKSWVDKFSSVEIKDYLVYITLK